MPTAPSISPLPATILDHERLDAYRVAVELDDLVAAASRSSSRGAGWLWDQALRAAASVVLNIAEACGRDGADRARCLRIARGSALETDAALTLLAHRRALDGKHRAAARDLCARLAGMLCRLIAAHAPGAA
jgi:four helix bundle protein